MLCGMKEVGVGLEARVETLSWIIIGTGSIALLAAAVHGTYLLYLTGWAVAAAGILTSVAASKATTRASALLGLALLFLAVRLIVPLKYGQLVGEDARNIVVVAKLLIDKNRLPTVAETVIPPLPLLQVFPGLPLLYSMISRVATVSVETLNVYAGPVISLVFLISLILLASTVSGGCRTAGCVTGLIAVTFPPFIYWQMTLLPQTLGIVFAALVVLLEGGRPSRAAVRYRGALYVVLTAALLMTHHLTVLVLAAADLVGSIVRGTLSGRMSLGRPLRLLVATLGYWIYVAGGLQFQLLVEIGRKIAISFLEPVSVLDYSYYQTGLFIEHPPLLAAAVAGQTIVVVGAGLYGIVCLFAGKSWFRSAAATLLGLVVVSAASLLIGLMMSISAVPERVAMFGAMATAVFAGVGLSRMLGSGRLGSRAVSLLAVGLILLPTPFKLFRFVFDHPPKYVYQRQSLSEIKDSIYGRLVYKGDDFFASSRFVIERSGASGVLYGDHSTSRQLAVLSPAVLGNIRLFPDEYAATDHGSPVLIFLDSRFVGFLVEREAQQYARDPRLQGEKLEAHNVVYSAGSLRVYSR